MKTILPGIPRFSKHETLAGFDATLNLSCFKKTFKIMKNKLLRILFDFWRLILYGCIVQTMVFTMALASGSDSQDIKNVKEVYLDIKISNASIIDVIKVIEKKTSYRFTYEKLDLNQKLALDLNLKQVSVANLLLILSEQVNLKFRQINNNINVSKLPMQFNKQSEIEVIIQTMKVTGKVLSSVDDEPLPGVNIVEKGTFNGTVTDIEGNYSLEVAEDATLVFSSIGFLPQEIAVGGRSVINVDMSEDLKQLEEIVVIGYGEQKKESVVGSIVQTTGRELMQSGGVSTVGQALTGRLPGVISISSTGRPGNESPEIYIRGQSTWNGGGQPLILVDGVERSKKRHRHQ